MSDLCERLQKLVSDDHQRGCEGRTYSCSCGYDDLKDKALVKAAAEIDRLRAELEEARRNLKLRDNFIVARGRSMWNDFVDVLPKRTSGND